jgi:hypothetical protein
MPTLTITDVDAVRSEGSLRSPSESNGAATNKQLQRAIRAAKRKMVEKIGKDAYETVRDFTSEELDVEANDDKHEAFLHAEACFAVADLIGKISIEQLSATGLIQSMETGKARTSFASSEEVKKISRGWEDDANRWLSSYLAVPTDAVTQEPTSFASRKGSLYVAAI